MGHRCCNKQKVKRGLWSPEEDERLLKHITCHGHGNWSSVPKLAGLQRCGKSCRLRWINYLRPDLKRGSFTPNEEQIIIDVHRILGNRWAQIAKHLPGRTDNEVKNFWNSCIKKKLISKGLDPKTHNLLSPHQRAALNIITTTAPTTTTTTNPAVLLNLQQQLHQQASSLPLPCSFDHGSNNMMSNINIITMDHHHHHHIPTLINLQVDDSNSNHLPSLNHETSPSNLLQQQQQQISNYGNVDIVNHDHDEAGLFWDGHYPPAFELAAMGPEKAEKVAVNIDDHDVDQYDHHNTIAINGDHDDHNYYDYYDQIAGVDHNHHHHHEVASHDDQQDRFDLAFMDPSLVHGAMYAADDHFVPMDDFAWNF